MASIALDYKLLENAGFNSQQAEAILSVSSQKMDETVTRQIQAIEKDVANKLDASETRFEKTLIREANELRKEIAHFRTEAHENTIKIIERLHTVESDVKFIKNLGGFLVGLGSIAAVVFGILHAHVTFA